MFDKLNKNVLGACLAAFFAANNVNAELINHRLLVKGTFSMPFGSSEKCFANITGKSASEVKSAENFKFQAGGNVEYDFFFNYLLGVGLDVACGYQKLDVYTKDSKNVEFGGFYLNPTLKVLVNFLEDGMEYDEEEEAPAGMKLGAFVGGGMNFNFGGADNKWEDIEVKAKKNKAKLPLFGFAATGGIFFELPLGLDIEAGYRLQIGGLLEAEEENKTFNDAKNNEFLRHDVSLSVGYNLGNLFI